MVAANFETALSLVLVDEGGWAEHAKDPGGATMKGVTLQTYREFLGRDDVTKPELHAISDAHLEAIYRRRYWDRVWGDQLPAGIDYCTFDAAVNSGPFRAVRSLQIAVGGLTVDGEMGPKTLAGATQAKPDWVVNRYCDVRLAFLKTAKHPKTGRPLWPTFGRGWEKRVAGVRAHSLAMIGD